MTNPLRICEELYYHSETNSRYIDELNKALDKIGIKPSTSTKRTHNLKEEFKLSSFYKTGVIYLNQQNKYGNEDVKSFPLYLKEKKFYYKVKTGFSSEATLLQNDDFQIAKEESIPISIKVTGLGLQVIRKAMQKLPFFTFKNLTKYYPNIQSIEEFITSSNYLGANYLEVSGKTTSVDEMSQEEKLQCALKILQEIQPDIERGNIEYKGSEIFVPNAIQKIFKNREMNFVLREDGDAETGYPMSRPKLDEHYLDLKKENWYAYEDNFGTSEEKKLILFLKGAMSNLKKKFERIYLLRNEKCFQIFRFSDGKPFEPDFVLFLKEKNTTELLVYQLFIEPKGDGYIELDQWKEDFLKEIENRFIIYQNSNYKLVGLPFFNHDSERQREFILAFDKYLN